MCVAPLVAQSARELPHFRTLGHYVETLSLYEMEQLNLLWSRVESRDGIDAQTRVVSHVETRAASSVQTHVASNARIHVASSVQIRAANNAESHAAIDAVNHAASFLPPHPLILIPLLPRHDASNSHEIAQLDLLESLLGMKHANDFALHNDTQRRALLASAKLWMQLAKHCRYLSVVASQWMHARVWQTAPSASRMFHPQKRSVHAETVV